MNMINDGGPAFPLPVEDLQCRSRFESGYGGMTLREYAAIHLRVPDSGVDWMDEMIRKAQRDELAAKALQGLLAAFNDCPDAGSFASMSYAMADAMLKAREASDD